MFLPVLNYLSRMNSRFLFLVACFILLTVFACAQTITKIKSAGVVFHFGSYLGESTRANHMRDSYSSFATLTYEQQFENEHGKPIHQKGSWGMALMHGNSGSRRYMGTVTAAFSYVYLPLFSSQQFSSKIRMGGGLSYLQKPFRVNTNQQNVYIGSHINTFTSFEWQNQIKVCKSFALYAGIHFIHFSNGAVKLPNKGVNIPAVTLGAKYMYQSSPAVISKYSLLHEQKKSLSFFLSGAVKQAPEVSGPYFIIPIGSVEFAGRTHQNGYWCAGLVASYDGSRKLKSVFTGENIYQEGSLQTGVYTGYEFSFGKLSVPLQLGVYLHNASPTSALFQQLGVRYKVSRKMRLQLLMKTHTKIAEYLSAGIGWSTN
jgi:hypothetical protein